MKEVHIHKREWHGAHQPWSYRPHAFRWYGETISGINFVPLAKEMRSWLLRQGFLSILSKKNQQVDGYTNPYTFSGSTIALVMARTVNIAHVFATQEAELDAVDAEIERLRIYNETILYAARFCETAIKQLLYCTQIPESLYKRMALGALLESPCKRCKKQNGKEPHNISLIGSLAHPFRLCLEFDHCAMNHLDMVNKLRNSRAAHSSIQTLDIRTPEESKNQSQAETNETLMDFLHMLSHLEKIESEMLNDLANKAKEINTLKNNGLKPDDCNFNLEPGIEFTSQTEKG
ncbi:hypothetical protein FA149_30450 [Pseudomonas aeruginosa]|nr:hypothetical protein [Pseudomonas aeruginosa]MCO3435149.1 hypothetical protein [Pseudomonas aeruginosa]MCO3443712.1 hypothetical protein [Pseudomonas aeruginosa]MCO3446382.1 hypothetical protein [Pseudomonas aeruginosa]MCO3455919.1 hypothetical protein [Pseudomonas aeruginosa]